MVKKSQVPKNAKKSQKQSRKNEKETKQNSTKKSKKIIKESKMEEEKEKTVNLTTVVSKNNIAVDSHFKDAQYYHVVKDVNSQFNGKFFSATLNKTDLCKNNNKFYICQILQHDNNPSDIVAYFRWGRVGAKGDSQEEKVGSLEAAVKKFLGKYKDKTRGGYKEIFIDYGGDEEDVKESAAPKKKEKSRKKGKKNEGVKLEKKVQELIELIYNKNLMHDAMREIGYDANKMPLGKLAQETLNEALKVLRQIDVELDKKNPSSALLLSLSSQFFTLVPHIFAYRNIASNVIDSKEKIKDKINMINSLSDMKITTKIIDSSSKSEEDEILNQLYSNLHCNIEHMDTTDPMYPIIDKYVSAKSSGYSYNQKLTLIDAYKLNRDTEDAKFTDFGNKFLLWHGSRITNFVGILSQGLRIAPPEAPSSGYCYGKGVYFADQIQKSACYCHPVNNIALILLCEVSLGKIEKRNSCDFNLPQTMNKENNSIHGVGGIVPSSGVYIGDKKDVYVPNGDSNSGGYGSYSEFIVYNTDQIKLKYLLKIRYG